MQAGERDSSMLLEDWGITIEEACSDMSVATVIVEDEHVFCADDAAAAADTCADHDLPGHVTVFIFDGTGQVPCRDVPDLLAASGEAAPAAVLQGILDELKIQSEYLRRMCDAMKGGAGHLLAGQFTVAKLPAPPTGSEIGMSLLGAS